INPRRILFHRTGGGEVRESDFESHRFLNRWGFQLSLWRQSFLPSCPRSPLSSRPRFVKRARSYCHSGDSRNPESFVRFCAGAIKDSGFLIGEKHSRYRSLFFYHQELRIKFAHRLDRPRRGRHLKTLDSGSKPGVANERCRDL
ncbi:MAG: hypothetical protein OXU88_08425, partial [Gammaproteobacteria bacterium]|nr:hypothetical protein [Gammaproteobacteria bacterium]